MNNVQLVQVSTGVFALRGDLNMYSVPDIERTFAAHLFASDGEIIIDLEEVSRSDSAGLALLVEWWKLAQRRNISLRFKHLPEQLQDIARISDLLSILPFDRDKSATPPLQ
jgi:phospholipid transport system transporter-binding protein